MDILLIEDETRLSKYLENLLKEDGHYVYCCGSLDEANAFIENRPMEPRLIILDRLLHGHDAVSLIPPFRTRFPSSPLLVLSAVNTASEKALALDKGADDYLAKPFSSIELLARIRALSRRDVSHATATQLTVGNLTIDLTTRSISAQGLRIHLSNKEFTLLHLFARMPGKVFSKSELYERVWETGPGIESNVVEATINNLRRKLESGKAGVVIKNMRNLGYWIEA